MVNSGFFNPLDIAIFTSAETFAEADFDQNGIVDGEDLAILLNAFGIGSGGDVDGDGDTDGADLLAIQRQFGGSLSGNVTMASVVPEPNTLMLLCCFLVFCCMPGRCFTMGWLP